MKRAQIRAPSSGSFVLTTGPPGKSLSFILNGKSILLHFCLTSCDRFLLPVTRLFFFDIVELNFSALITVMKMSDSVSPTLLCYDFCFITALFSFCYVYSGVFFFIIPGNTSNFFPNIYLNV